MKNYPSFFTRGKNTNQGHFGVRLLLICGVLSSINFGVNQSNTVKASSSDGDEVPYTTTNQHKNGDDAEATNNHVLGNTIEHNYNLDDSASTDTLHKIIVPSGAPSDVEARLFSDAKVQATADAEATGRTQQIIQSADQTATIQIGNSLYPRADVIDVASYQYWLTQANFNTLKSLG